jgi:hypothetical protein
MLWPCISAAAEQDPTQTATPPSSEAVPSGEGAAPAPADSIPAAAEAERLLAEPLPVTKPSAPADASTATPATEPPAGVRVNHVPEFIRQEIRDAVRTELRQDVVQDVLTHAQTERWGVPGVLPEWIDRIKIKGDFRLRYQGEFYDDDNDPFGYSDFQAANARGGFGSVAEPFINTTEERHRLRTRVRVGVDARITNDVKAVVQMSTGSTSDPVSTNQTLGNTGNRSTVLFDQAYLKIDDLDLDRYPWLTLWAGRMANPWLSTDLVFDGDLAFEGLAATYRYNLHGSEDLLDMSERDRTLFFTAGAFPIQEVALSPEDKMLYGAQLGTEFIFLSQSRLKFAVAYYDYVNITGERDPFDTGLKDYTVPGYVQKGNTLFAIGPDANTSRWALASDYNLANATLVYDNASFAPHHIVFSADYVRNVGFDKNDIRKRTGWTDAQMPSELTTGYQIQVAVGWPLVLERYRWRVTFAYKYLEADAVLDAFTDSDFHLGGTDAKGWILGGEYAVLDNTWITLRWITADAIDGAPFGVDVLQLDMNAKF